MTPAAPERDEMTEPPRPDAGLEPEPDVAGPGEDESALEPAEGGPEPDAAGPGGDGGAPEPAEAEEEIAAASVPAEEAKGEAAEPAHPEAVAETAAEFLRGLIAVMGLTAEVSAAVEGGTAYIDVTGGDLGVLIGRRGQTLDALQEVARTAVQRRLRARVRLLVDVEGYRARRKASLAEYARSIAERAKERGTEIELEPMNAYERKIVHDAVSEIDGATSFSEGEEPYRKVVVRGE